MGAVIYPIALEKLIPQIGFAWSVRAVALIMAATLAISNATLKSRLPPRKVGPLVEPKAFLQASYSLYTVGAFLAFWGLYTPFFYATSYTQKIGAPENVSLYVLSMMNVLSFCEIWVDNRLLRYLGEYYRTLLPTSWGQLTFSFPQLPQLEYSCLVGLEYRHGKVFLCSGRYMVSSLELWSVYLRLVSGPSPTSLT